jgi:hypothetical protein
MDGTIRLSIHSINLYTAGPGIFRMGAGKNLYGMKPAKGERAAGEIRKFLL